ncbi:MAG TPA: TonB-dependent receptor plug domain-containing protein [Gemmatimonadaceae bacterium]
MTARGAALSLACCISLAWASPPRRAMAQNAEALAAAARQSGSETTQSAAGAGGVADTSVAPLERRVSLALTDVTLRDALQEIVSQSGINLSYSSRVLPVERRVSARLTRVTVRAALEKVLAGTGIEVREEGARIILARRHEVKTSDASEADTTGHGAVSVRVTDSASTKPLEGAVVMAKGTDLSATTNAQGYALLPRLPSGLGIITARHFGYASEELHVVVAEAKTVRVDFAMKLGMTRLQQMVTTATGPRRRLELGNDITVVNADSIAATQPIRSVSDLLATRVPGLVAQTTTGAPGDPTRIRLRGLHSVLQSNDPIVIVNGIRVYAEQSAARSSNLATPQAGNGYHAPVPAPSPLDQIDPNSIETIEVLKGPSAATLYGADAANGVIVVTTKKGRPGPARWSAHIDYGQTTMPGGYPAGYFWWGHRMGSYESQFCRITDQTCVRDSLVRFQLLNDPRYTVLGTGNRTAGTVGISGGSEDLTYSVTGSLSDELGLLALPSAEATRYVAAQGTAPASWMRRPHHYRSWGATTMLSARLGRTADASLTASLTRSNQQRSTLETQLGSLMRTYPASVNGLGLYYRAAPSGGFVSVNSIFGDFYRRITDVSTTFTNGASFNWRPRSWLTGSADVGVNFVSRDDQMALPTGIAFFANGIDSAGEASIGRGTTLMRTVNARLTATAQLFAGFKLQTAVGVNYTGTSITDFFATGRGLRPGTSSLNGATEAQPPSERRSDLATFGWYIEPTISHKRFWISTGLRIDGGSTFGSHATVPHFPKVSVSYLISDEPFFPFKNLFNTLRLRVAYGHAGVQPGVTDRLRLYEQAVMWADSQFVNGTVLQTLGNTDLKPERSSEIEGGFDADFLDDRVSAGLTVYRNTRLDALIRVPIPPSVDGGLVGSVLKNVGVIRNTGWELELGVEPFRGDAFGWGVRFMASQNHNKVVSLAPGVVPFGTLDARVVAGYPLYGRWARPILGYRDVNSDGKIESYEVQIGDSLVFMGESEPNYEATFSTHFTFFRSALRIDADFHYENGLTQYNQTALDNQIFSRALNDSTTPFGQQAAVAVMKRTQYGLMQTVNTLRFNSLNVSYAIPRRIARRLRTDALSVSVQGNNLGLFTNYRGKDPNVNAYGSGNSVVDTGVLPMPRTWQLRVSATY